MPGQDDHLSNEVALNARLDETGVTFAAKSRAVAAFDRLVGSVLDIPAAHFERIAAKIRVKQRIGEQLEQARADLTLDGLAAEVLEDRARKKANAECIAVEALEALKRLPPPQSVNGETFEQPHADEPSKLDDDWMNQFVRYSEEITSENLQQLWGQVLANEIRSPGGYSKQTLRFIYELDSETAKLCEDFSKLRVGDHIPYTEDFSRGDLMYATIELRRMGLIEGVGGSQPTQNFALSNEGVAMIGGDTKALILKGRPGVHGTYSSLLLTRLGKQVMSLLAHTREEEALRELSKLIPKDGLEQILLGAIQSRRADFLTATPLYQVWSSHPPSGLGTQPT